MATKTKPRPVAKAPVVPAKLTAAAAKAAATAAANSANELPRTLPTTAEEYVLHIRLLGKRLDGHVAFMCAAEKLTGTSSEAKLRSLGQFYGRLFAFEQELGRIREELQLG